MFPDMEWAESGVLYAYLFGSRAQRRSREDSDYDVAVWYSPELTALQRFDLSCRLQEKLEKALRKPVDLVILNDARPTLQEEAVLKGVPLYPLEPESTFRFESKIRQRSEDYRYSQRFFTEARRRRLGIS